MPTPEFVIRRSACRKVTAVSALSGRSFVRHSHDEFGVGLITGGAQRSWSGRGAVEAEEGDLITTNPGEVHDGAPIGGTRAWSMLYFSPELVSAVVTDASAGKITSRELHAPVLRDHVASGYFRAAYAALVGANADTEFDEPCTLLFGSLLEDGPPRRLQAPMRLRLTRERIDDDPVAAHSLAELAAIAGLSRYHLIRAFAQMTGFTPHRYVIQRRLDLARRLIRNGLALASAAAEAGFSDQSHLHREFVARYGFTPGAFVAAGH